MVRVFIFLCLAFCCFACQPVQTFDEAAERAKIMELHKAQREFHFGNKPVAFVDQLSDEYISVNRGKIDQPKRADSEERFRRYFSNVEFVKWDDLADPIIRFSPDGQLAYTIVDKEVVYRYAHEEGEPEEERTHFSWVAIYKKYPDGWKIDCVVSTNEPPETKKVE